MILRVSHFAALLLGAAGACAAAAPSPASLPPSATNSATDAENTAWGLVRLSVASAREEPAHAAEMGTQFPLGHAVRILQAWEGWYRVTSASGYEAWVEAGAITRCTPAEVETWENGALVVVTALESVVLSRPDSHSDPVSDVVLGNRLRLVGRESAWLRVEFPDGRRGYLPADAAEDFRAWRQGRRPSPAAIEATARRLLGRPYLWGGNTPKGLDCSGFTQLVFGQFDITLPHRAGRQSALGTEVPLGENRRQLRPGDLVFFGSAAAHAQPEKVVHVGLCLPGGLVIHAAECVRLNRLEEMIGTGDASGHWTLLRARRLFE